MAQTGTPRPPASELSLGELVAQASKDVSLLIRGELNLAKVELRDDLRRIIIAVALLGVSAFVGCLMLVLLCFAFAYGLMTLGIWDWAARPRDLARGMAAVAGPVVAAVPVVAQVGEQALPVRRQRVAGAVRAVPFPMNFSTIATAWVWAWRNWARLPPIPTICAGCATRWRPTTCG